MEEYARIRLTLSWRSASGERAGVAAGFYLIAYLATTLAAFGVVTVLSTADRDADLMLDYRGLGARRPWLAAIFAVALFSLAGMPLTMGFIGKFVIVAAGAGSALWALVIVLVVTRAVGLYYTRLIVAMYVRRPEELELAGTGPCRARRRRGRRHRRHGPRPAHACSCWCSACTRRRCCGSWNTPCRSCPGRSRSRRRPPRTRAPSAGDSGQPAGSEIPRRGTIASPKGAPPGGPNGFSRDRERHLRVLHHRHDHHRGPQGTRRVPDGLRLRGAARRGTHRGRPVQGDQLPRRGSGDAQAGRRAPGAPGLPGPRAGSSRRSRWRPAGMPKDASIKPKKG